ncbi:biotin-independent malonate decarboxylase subunit beta [Alicyclobacillus tolerans]|uniref:biotin-independent malonate decarboxylase subunit beta n=1 Tax=Alicyclobacillus tolerans TaxID=90970 RepID=UPI001F030186|nr:biotin-independent malonate decarboxylase subunit beta [Alicyclobacillus tolerans]MCF8563210.1 biotin-independent malonate decarboxylase subunit beta [Alicyclobacillus tolerans]
MSNPVHAQMNTPGMLARASFIELTARGRAKAVMDPGTFRELLDPFERITSPHLPVQGIVGQSDDGAVVARGEIDGQPAVVISLEGKFQGGGVGEVSGAKIAGTLELAVQDNQRGTPTRAVLLLETGGVRLQEANYGLLAVADVHAAIVSLRRYQPVVAVVAGMIGCFGGMSIAAGLCSHVVMTRQGRFGLNGPEVIEQEAGVAEFDSRNRELIWSTVGGEQRVLTGLADTLVDDDAEQVARAVRGVFAQPRSSPCRSTQVERFLSRLRQIDPSVSMGPAALRSLWGNPGENPVLHSVQSRDAAAHRAASQAGLAPASASDKSRGMQWFEALTGVSSEDAMAGTASVLCADAALEEPGNAGGATARFVCVAQNPGARFPRVRHGEVGLEEGWTIARVVREAIAADEGKRQRPIVAIVDVPGQAFGYREELLGIHLALAAAVDAYATARLAGHPVISLVVGNAISGAFLAHGLQANRIMALADPQVAVHVMSKKSAARVTRRSVEELDEAAQKVPGIAYDVGSFAKLGALYQLVEGIDADAPSGKGVLQVQKLLREAIADVEDVSEAADATMEVLEDAIAGAEKDQKGGRDLSSRLSSPEAKHTRAASILVRSRLAKQWN